MTQLVSPAVPVRVLQATLQQLEGNFTLPVAAPADALPESGVKRGGIVVGVQPKLSGACPACGAISRPTRSSAWSRRRRRPSA
jgi:hypothetical protein